MDTVHHTILDRCIGDGFSPSNVSLIVYEPKSKVGESATLKLSQ